jgi:hypothetical protein
LDHLINFNWQDTTDQQFHETYKVADSYENESERIEWHLQGSVPKNAPMESHNPSFENFVLLAGNVGSLRRRN